jgi:gluconate kinase
VPVLLITGPVGVGKTTIASEVSERLDQLGIPHALVDVDSLRWCYPRPPADRFRIQLAMRNLSLIWPNFVATGARRLVLVDVVESTADLHRIVAAVPGADIRLVRLRARLETLQARVQQREQGLGRDRMLRRALELATQMDGHPIEDVLVETDNRPISDIVEEILEWSGWLADAGT